MTAEVQPVCARCGHTRVEHQNPTGPCHQRSAAGVGCDCGGWAEGHAPEPPERMTSGDPIDTDEAALDAIERALHERDPHGGWDPYEVMPVLRALTANGFLVIDTEGADRG